MSISSRLKIKAPVGKFISLAYTIDIIDFEETTLNPLTFSILEQFGNCTKLFFVYSFELLSN